MDFVSIFLTVAVIHLLAVMSPGPDFIMIARNTLAYSRRSGVYSAVGLGLGILVHVAYSLVGIGLLISQSVALFSVIKFIGAAYLVYVGYKSLRAPAPNKSEEIPEKREISPGAAIKIGFITNVTNPKATLFFLSLFTLVITTPLALKLAMGIEMSLATTGWFALVAAVISHRSIRGRINTIQHWAERVMGGLLILLGLRLATTAHK